MGCVSGGGGVVVKDDGEDGLRAAGVLDCLVGEEEGRWGVGVVGSGRGGGGGGVGGGGGLGCFAEPFEEEDDAVDGAGGGGGDC